MKTNKFLFFICLCVGSLFIGTSQAQQGGQSLPTEIVTAFQEGNSNKLSNYFNSTVELSVLSNNNVYSKQQATAIMDDFFKKNPVQSYQTIHNGTKDSASFFIGTLKTNNDTYRVSILVRSNTIQQLRIEKN